MLKAIGTAIISAGCMLTVHAESIFFTQLGSPDVYSATFNPGSGTVTGTTPIGSSPQGADGIQVGPNNTLFFAGEHTDITGHWGTVHAAMRSGLRAAAQILGT